MQASAILTDERLSKFCKEMGISSSKIIIKIDDKQAKYYNFDDEQYYNLDLEIAKKYM